MHAKLEHFKQNTENFPAYTVSHKFTKIAQYMLEVSYKRMTEHVLCHSFVGQYRRAAITTHSINTNNNNNNSNCCSGM